MKLALGTAQFGSHYGLTNNLGKVPLYEVKKIISKAKEINLKTIDTAMDYFDSEEVLGKTNVTDFEIISKLPEIPKKTNIKVWIQDKVKKSLFNLKVLKLRGLLLHKPIQMLQSDGDEIFNSLNHLKEIGLIEKIGVSVYNFEELDILIKKFKFDIVQAPINIFDRRIIDSKTIYELKKKNIEIHARSIFLQGLLLLEKNKLPKKFLYWKNLWNEWFNWLDQESKISNLSACLNYVFSIKEIDKIIIGVNNYIQFKEILEETRNYKNITIPKFKIEDKKLLNPYNWKYL